MYNQTYSKNRVNLNSSGYNACFIFSLASAIDDIQEEEESHYVDKLKEYCLYADSIRYFFFNMLLTILLIAGFHHATQGHFGLFKA